MTITKHQPEAAGHQDVEGLALTAGTAGAAESSIPRHESYAARLSDSAFMASIVRAELNQLADAREQERNRHEQTRVQQERETLQRESDIAWQEHQATGKAGTGELVHIHKEVSGPDHVPEAVGTPEPTVSSVEAQADKEPVQSEPALLTDAEVKALQRSLKRSTAKIASELVPRRNFRDSAKDHEAQQSQAVADFKATVRARLRTDAELKARLAAEDEGRERTAQVKEARQAEAIEARAKAHEHREAFLAELEAGRAAHAAREKRFDELMGKARIEYGALRLNKEPGLRARVEKEAHAQAAREFGDANTAVEATSKMRTAAPTAEPEQRSEAREENSLTYDSALDGSYREWYERGPAGRQIHRDKVEKRITLARTAVEQWDAIDALNANGVPAKDELYTLIRSAARASKDAIRALDLSPAEQKALLKEIDALAREYRADYRQKTAPKQANAVDPIEPAVISGTPPQDKGPVTVVIEAQPAPGELSPLEKAEDRLNAALARLHDEQEQGAVRPTTHNNVRLWAKNVRRLLNNEDDQVRFDEWLNEQLKSVDSKTAVGSGDAAPGPGALTTEQKIEAAELRFEEARKRFKELAALGSSVHNFDALVALRGEIDALVLELRGLHGDKWNDAYHAAFMKWLEEDLSADNTGTTTAPPSLASGSSSASANQPPAPKAVASANLAAAAAAPPEKLSVAEIGKQLTRIRVKKWNIWTARGDKTKPELIRQDPEYIRLNEEAMELVEQLPTVNDQVRQEWQDFLRDKPSLLERIRYRNERPSEPINGGPAAATQNPARQGETHHRRVGLRRVAVVGAGLLLVGLLVARAGDDGHSSEPSASRQPQPEDSRGPAPTRAQSTTTGLGRLTTTTTLTGLASRNPEAARAVNNRNLPVEYADGYIRLIARYAQSRGLDIDIRRAGTLWTGLSSRNVQVLTDPSRDYVMPDGTHGIRGTENVQLTPESQAILNTMLGLS